MQNKTSINSVFILILQATNRLTRIFPISKQCLAQLKTFYFTFEKKSINTRPICAFTIKISLINLYKIAKYLEYSYIAVNFHTQKMRFFAEFLFFFVYVKTHWGIKLETSVKYFHFHNFKPKCRFINGDTENHLLGNSNS